VLRREIRMVVEHLCDSEETFLNRNERERRIEEVLTDAAADLASQIDWAEVARIAAERRGVPEPISAPLSRSLGAEFGAISASSG